MADNETSSQALEELAEAPPASRRLARILSDANILSDDELLAVQKQHPGEYLGDVLVSEGILIESYLYGLLIRSLYVPCISADRCQVHPDTIGLVPESFCRERQLLPVHRARDFLTVVCANPLDEEAVESVRDITGMKVRVALCLPGQLQTLMKIVFAAAEHEAAAGGGGGEAETGQEAKTVVDAGVGARAAELADQLEAQSGQAGQAGEPDGAADAPGPGAPEATNEDSEDDESRRA